MHVNLEERDTLVNNNRTPFRGKNKNELWYHRDVQRHTNGFLANDRMRFSTYTEAFKSKRWQKPRGDASDGTRRGWRSRMMPWIPIVIELLMEAWAQAQVNGQPCWLAQSKEKCIEIHNHSPCHYCTYHCCFLGSTYLAIPLFRGQWLSDSKTKTDLLTMG